MKSDLQKRGRGRPARGVHFWAGLVFGEPAKKRLIANLGNLSLYCQPPKSCPKGTTDLNEVMKQWTLWPGFPLLESIENSVLTLALSERKFASRRIWEAFVLVNRRTPSLHLLEHIKALVGRALDRFRESGRAKLEDVSWEQERDADKALRSFINARPGVHANPSSWMGEPGVLVRWLLKIGYPDTDELKAFNPGDVLMVRLGELRENEREREAKLERLSQRAKKPAIKRTKEDAEDVQLMLLVVKGDMKAFAELQKRHQKGVKHEVLEVLNDDSAADEITNNVFIQLLKAAPRYVPAAAKFRTWLLQIAKNMAKNANKQARTRKKRERDFAYSAGIKAAAISRDHDDIPEDEQDGETLFDPTTETPMPGEGIDHGQVMDKLSELPKLQRQIVLACECEGRDHQDVAGELGITADEVKRLKREALAQLRRAVLYVQL